MSSFEEEVIRVLVADSTRMHTQLLAEALKRDRFLDVITSGSYSRDLISVADLYNVNVAVVSSTLEEKPGWGFELLRELHATHPQVRSIVMLDTTKRELILEAFKAGVRGVFGKFDSVEPLCKCIRSVHQGQIWASSEQMAYAVEALASAPTVRAVDSQGMDLLSRREREVVQGLAEGLSNREIAERLHLSQHTVKNYLFRIFDKLGVSNRTELLFMTLTQAGAHQAETAANLAGHYDQTSLAGCKDAAEHGLTSGQLALAKMLGEGSLVPQDRVAAYAWCLVAEETGRRLNQQIMQEKAMLRASLGAEQIAEAEVTAKQLLGKSPEPPARCVRGADSGATHLLAV